MAAKPCLVTERKWWDSWAALMASIAIWMLPSVPDHIQHKSHKLHKKKAVKSRISILWLLKCITGRGNNRREREQKEETNHFWSQPERKDQKWAHDESGSQWCVLQWHPTTPDLPQTVGWWCQGTPHHRALQDRSVIKTDKPFNQISRKVDEEESEKRKKRK